MNARDYITDARELAALADTAEPDQPLIQSLLYPASTWLLHGDPRALKSWTVLEMLVAGATGTPAFGRLMTRPFTSLLVTNEDGGRRIGERVSALARGRGCDVPMGKLAVSAHRGVWLDSQKWQIEVLKQAPNYDVIAFDPLRSVTGCVDQGPKEFQPFATFARKLVSAGATVVQVHHDSKPQVGQTDTRRRAHRASGGGVFSAADAPVHAERIGEEPRIILTASAWKHWDDPPPLEVSLAITKRDGKMHTASMTARAVSATSSAEAVLQGRIRQTLIDSPGLSGSEIAKRVRAAKATVLSTLSQMPELDFVVKGNKTEWMVREVAA